MATRRAVSCPQVLRPSELCVCLRLYVCMNVCECECVGVHVRVGVHVFL
jgi:hypothetical protein